MKALSAMHRDGELSLSPWLLERIEKLEEDASAYHRLREHREALRKDREPIEVLHALRDDAWALVRAMTQDGRDFGGRIGAARMRLQDCLWWAQGVWTRGRGA